MIGVENDDQHQAKPMSVLVKPLMSVSAGDSYDEGTVVVEHLYLPFTTSDTKHATTPRRPIRCSPFDDLHDMIVAIACARAVYTRATRQTV